MLSSESRNVNDIEGFLALIFFLGISLWFGGVTIETWIETPYYATNHFLCLFIHLSALAKPSLPEGSCNCNYLTMRSINIAEC